MTAGPARSHPRASGDLGGRTYVITGATSGIGRASAGALARRGAHVVLACRSAARARVVVAEIAAGTGEDRAEHLPLDLADLASVRAAAERVLAADRPVHGLIANAGVAGRRGATAQGFELAFGVNHLGHFLLITLLLDRLRQSRPARVVMMGSISHRSVRTIDFEAATRPTRTLTGLHEYAVSKLCNVLVAQELARRLDGRGVTAYAVDPGFVASDIWRRVPWPVRPAMTRFMRSPEDGASGPVHAATAGGLERRNGGYLVRTRPRPASPFATPGLAAELWRRSEAWTAGTARAGTTQTGGRR